MDMVMGLLLGVSLSAACGFRVFVPMFVASVGAMSGYLPIDLAPGFEWLGTPAAAIALGVATGLEIAAFYIPWLDNLLDSIATPASIVAGVLMTAPFVDGMGPVVQWTVATVAGGGAAGAVQVLTVVTRAASTVTTGGLGNPVVSTAEAGASVVLSVLALVATVIAAILVIGLVVWLIVKLARRRRHPPTSPPPLAA